MGDQEEGSPRFGLHRLDQLEDLRLDGDVQAGGRLVGDQEVWPNAKGDTDHHTLAHPATELVRVALGHSLGSRDPGAAQHGDGLCIGRAVRHPFVERIDTSKLVSDPHQWIQGGAGILKNHGDLPATDVAHFTLGESKEVDAIKDYLARERR